MLRSSCVLPVLLLQLLLDRTCSAVLPDRNEREIDWQDQDLSPRRDAGSVQAGLSQGSVLAVDARPPQPVSVQNPRKKNQKRRKLAPLDSIGGFLMSRSRSRQDEPDRHWEDYRK
ncbi:hypothetical protein D4764_03G0000960 [Takifugu flavidus]|uniref:Uncharacterized protein n=1 Tax=Takifugu flavidus TaxID=433684 RepID=A0A5C6N8I4_9TELE|nr:hypothetical protein D4764_03G0000960 [Takifugu flavidus]